VLITVGIMRKQIGKLMVAIGFAAAVVGGTITSCDDNENFAGPGTAGTGGSSVAGHGGTTGTSTGGANAAGGIGGTTLTVFTMAMSGSDVMPPNSSTASANVVVSLDRSTGALTVTGTFKGLSSNATEADIHGPAAAGAIAPAIVPLQVQTAMSGAVMGTRTMDTSSMNEMINGMTYVDIHSVNFPDGEIRAQIK
jgi:hypothetical protein